MSSEEQVAGHSLGGQTAAIYEQARLDRAELDRRHVFVDAAMSGADPTRPGYQAMLAAASRGEFRVLYVWAFDRLGRDAEELLRTRRMLEAAGVTLISVTEGTAASTLVYGLRALIAQEERERIGVRTRLGLRARVSCGKYPGGRAPYGYRWRLDSLAVVVEQALAVRWIYDEYLRGSGVARIAHALNTARIAAPASAAWSGNEVSLILRNPVYAGRVRLADEVVPGVHKAVVDAQTWAAVQSLRKRRQREYAALAGRYPSGRHLLTHGLLRCGICGGAMSPRRLHERHRDVYRCLARNRPGGSASCWMPQIERSQVDVPVLDLFLDTVLDQDGTIAYLRQIHEERSRDARQRLTAARREIAQTHRRLERITQDYQDGLLGPDDWHEQQVALKGELAHLKLTIRSLDASTPIDVRRILDQRLAEIRSSTAADGPPPSELEPLREALHGAFTRVNLIMAADGNRSLEPQLRAQAVPVLRLATSSIQ